MSKSIVEKSESSALGSKSIMDQQEVVGAIVRTALSKCGSSNSLKKGNTTMYPAQSTRDEVVIDGVRGNTIGIKSLVLLTGDVTIDPIQSGIADRVDRVKILGEAFLECAKSGKALTLSNIQETMVSLWELYKGKRTLKQPTSEQFDEMIGEVFSASHRDAMLAPIGYSEKKGNFVVRDLKVQVVAGSTAIGTEVGNSMSIDGISESDKSLINSLVKTAIPEVKRPAKVKVSGGVVGKKKS